MFTPIHVIRRIVAFALLFSLFNCQATPIDIRGEFVDSEAGNSWIGTWRIIGPVFDFVAIRIHPDSEAVASYQSPGGGNFADFSNTISLAGDWEHVATMPFLTAASGTVRSDLRWNAFYEQDRIVPFVFETASFLGDELKFSLTFDWPGFGSISATSSDWAPTRAEIDAALTLVPLPGTVILSVIGLILVGFCRRRMSTGEQ